MEKYIQRSMAAGLIQPSSFPIGVDFFFVETKNKSLCPCIHFHGLNNISLRNKYLLPVLPSTLDSQGAGIFSKLDLSNTYHVVRIQEGDEWKSAFKTPTGHYKYLVMLFGLSSSPPVF